MSIGTELGLMPNGFEAGFSTTDWATDPIYRQVLSYERTLPPQPMYNYGGDNNSGSMLNGGCDQIEGAELDCGGWNYGNMTMFAAETEMVQAATNWFGGQSLIDSDTGAWNTMYPSSSFYIPGVITEPFGFGMGLGSLDGTGQSEHLMVQMMTPNGSPSTSAPAACDVAYFYGDGYGGTWGTYGSGSNNDWGNNDAPCSTDDTGQWISFSVSGGYSSQFDITINLIGPLPSVMNAYDYEQSDQEPNYQYVEPEGLGTAGPLSAGGYQGPSIQKNVAPLQAQNHLAITVYASSGSSFDVDYAHARAHPPNDVMPSVSTSGWCPSHTCVG